MAGLGKVRPRGDWRRLLLLGGALGTLLAGLLVVTAVGARVVEVLLVEFDIPREAARQIAIATTTTVPPVLLGGTLLTIHENPRVRLVGLAGVAIALSGVASGLPLGFETALWFIGGIYGVGLLLVLASILHGLVVEKRGGTAGQSTGWTGESVGTGTYRSSRSQTMPPDGGEEGDDLSFLLEDEGDRD